MKTTTRDWSKEQETVEIVYETEGMKTFCWIFGPGHLVNREMEKYQANYPYGTWGTKVIQQVSFHNGWVSIGLERKKGMTPSRGGRSFEQQYTGY